jgi:DNA modification methylase
MIDFRLGDCLEILPTIPDASIDAIITDPPYPEVDRSYGRMTESEWHEMMRTVVFECRRILKPTGSTVFILQPNSERVGRMRPWLWEFMAWTAREWNQIQDAWWWNTTALPLTKNDPHALRSSVKACVWLGNPDCFHDASGVRWSESEVAAATRQTKRCYGKHYKTEGRANVVYSRAFESAPKNGGVTPYNLLPIAAGGPRNPSSGHGAPTPIDLTDWWTRYICPPDGTILDPFMGSGTTGQSALKYGCDFIGIEKDTRYLAIAERRIAAELAKTALLDGVAS